MLTADLTVTSNGSATKPGGAGATVYALVSDPSTSPGQVLRRVAATSTTTPQELKVAHQITGKGQFGQMRRSLVRFDLKKINVDLSTVGGVIPRASVQLVIERPVYSGGQITDAEVNTLVGSLIDVVTASGQLAKLLNAEA